MPCRLIGAKPLSNRCWNIVSWTLRNRFRWIVNANSHISENMHLKLSFVKRPPFYRGLNVLVNELLGAAVVVYAQRQFDRPLTGWSSWDTISRFCVLMFKTVWMVGLIIDKENPESWTFLFHVLRIWGMYANNLHRRIYCSYQIFVWSCSLYLNILQLPNIYEVAHNEMALHDASVT